VIELFNWFCQGLIEEDALGLAYTLCEVVYEEKLVIMLQTPLRRVKTTGGGDMLH